MMTINKAKLSLSFSAAILLAACAQQVSEPVQSAAATESTDAAKPVTLAPPITTIKPGASVTFSVDEAETIMVGENGSVTLTVNEGYPSGVLHLKASGGNGLSVFGAERVARMDMASGTSHQWRIDYSADADGVYLINILATAELDGFSEMRAHSIRVKVGNWQTAKAEADAARKTAILPDGERAVILPAEETIE